VPDRTGLLCAKHRFAIGRKLDNPGFIHADMAQR